MRHVMDPAEGAALAYQLRAITADTRTYLATATEAQDIPVLRLLATLEEAYDLALTISTRQPAQPFYRGVSLLK